MLHQHIVTQILSKPINQNKSYDTFGDSTLGFVDDSELEKQLNVRKSFLLNAISINYNKRNYAVHQTCVQYIQNQTSTHVPSLFVKLLKTIFLRFVVLQVFESSKNRG